MDIRSEVKKILKESLGDDVKTVYHGTSQENVESIISGGLKAGSKGYDDVNWFVVATDFKSALYHAKSKDGGDVFVVEFEVPINNSKWEGFPYFWPPYTRNASSSWYALKRPIESEFIKKVHTVSYDEFLLQKSKKY